MDERIAPSKEDLEVEKLQAELKDLNRPWWQRHLPALLTTIVALLSLLFAFTSGIFDARYATLELKKESLKRDVELFQTTKDSLVQVSRVLNLTNDSLRLYADGIRSEADILSKDLRDRKIEVARAKASLQPIAQRAAYFEGEVRRAQNEYASGRTKFITALSNQHINEYEFEKETEQLKGRIGALKNDTAFLHLQVKWLQNNPYIAKNKKYEFDTYFTDHCLEYSKQREEHYKQDRNRDQRGIDSMSRSIDSLDNLMRIDGIDRK